MSDDARSQAGHPPLGALAGVAGMFVAGGVGGLLVGAFALNGMVDQDAGGVTSVLVGSTVLTAMIAITLWLKRGRYGRAFALGMALCWAGLGFFFWTEDGDHGMSDEEIDHEVAVVRAAGAPAYYLGDEAAGDELATVSVDGGGDFGASGPSFGYGLTCGDGTCLSDVTVETLTVDRDYLDAYGCERLQPVLGVPAASWDHWLLLFTGESLVTIDDPNAYDDHQGELTLAPRLRRLGEVEPLTALPPPSHEVLALVDDACGAS